MYFYLGYRIDKARHEAISRALAESKQNL
jgi:hypothetical protein